MEGKFFKVVFLSLVCLFVNTISYSQQITLEDLIKEESQYKVKGAKKKWVEELSVSNNFDSSLLILKTEFDKLIKSKNWLSDQEEEANIKVISCQTYKKMYMDRLVADIKSAGFVLTNAALTEHSRTLVYSKNNINIEVVAYTTETTATTLYLVSLLY